MSQAAAERNLLIGTLALQLDFITREALIAAVSAWALDKSRPLDEILCEQGALTDARRRLLGPLAQEHLRAHGDDPGASLAALGVPSTAADGLRQVGDPDVEATLARAGSGSGAGPSATLSYEYGAAPVGDRFRVLRPLARGGIGVVSVALDAELNREVALKQILPAQAHDPVSRARFTLEAEVTGRLEHPGVVPVYGLGCGPDGQPYYAMRLIKGESLKEALGRFHAAGGAAGPGGPLALRGLLNRFVAVCYAVAYAHSRGVIHRDLKPSNVMLGPYGETLVVDWGLAKVVGRGDPGDGPAAEATLRPGSGSGVGETAAGSAVGTPAYMSPEQAEGRLEALGPPSDVYSLGATLYCLLTGRPPFDDRDVGDVLRATARGEFPTPRAVNPRAPRALEAVCLKAMALKPEDRYPSARALAGEVEHWLADEPVAAYREPWLTRLARWGRRNKTSVAAAVALLATAVVALSAGAVLLGRANARAERERDLARRNFATARRAVDDYLTRVGRNPLLKEQGLHDLRQELLEAALGYYQDFLRQQGDAPGVRAEAAAACERVGDIHRELGRFGEAVAAYDQGLALARALPDGAATTAARLRMEGARVACLAPLGRFAEAIAAFERTVARLPNGRTSGDVRTALVKLYNAGASVYRNSGATDRGLRASQRALEIGEAHAADRPDDLEALRDLMTAYTYATRGLNLAGRADEAARLGERGTARGEAAVRDHPRDIDLRVAVSDLLHQMAILDASRGRPEQALGYERRSVALLEDVSRENPLLFRPRQVLVAALGYLSNIECDLGRADDARRSAERAVGYAEAFLSRVPDSPGAREMLGSGLMPLGKSQLKAGDTAGAVATLRRSADILERLSEAVDLYNAACSLSLISSVDDPAGPGSTDDRRARRARDADRAVEALKKAIDHGMLDLALVKTDPDLEPIRSRDDVQALIRLMEARSRAGAPAPP
jgi:serine/threonine-protein kinase